MNYKIIGADQKEYGPVSETVLRQWISEGRVNQSTLLQAEGTEEWKPLSSFPEFNTGFKTPPPMGEGIPSGGPSVFGSDLPGRNYEVDVGHCVGRAWELVKRDFWPIVGAGALITLLVGAANSAIIGIVITGPMLGGLSLYYLKKIRGESVDLGVAFSGFNIAFLELFLGMLVSGLLITLGFVCLILPGIYLAVAWQFTLPLIIDRKLSFWEAMELSRKTISQHWWNFFGLAIILFLVHLLGLLACGIGIFVALPVAMIAWLYAYEDIFGGSRTTASPPR